MQLCIGTSLGIIVSTTMRSYREHRARGFVLTEACLTRPCDVGRSRSEGIANTCVFLITRFR